MSLVVYLNSVNSKKFGQPMYSVIHMQDPGSVRVNQDHGSLVSLVGSRVSVADPVPSLLYGVPGTHIQPPMTTTSPKPLLTTPNRPSAALYLVSHLRLC